jgi:hypothetical protein
VRFLRRRPDDAADGVAEETPADPGRPGTKGRPTPKRRDAEGRRRGPAPPPPRTQRESMRLAKQNRASRAERKRTRQERYAKMQAGDDKALPARDRGPVKAHVRDLVDSRRHLMGLFMPMALVAFVTVALPLEVRNIVNLVTLAVILAMAIEGVLLGRGIAKQARERFPKEDIRGPSIGWYAFSRAFQLRRLRVPKPRVKVGAQL